MTYEDIRWHFVNFYVTMTITPLLIIIWIFHEAWKGNVNMNKIVAASYRGIQLANKLRFPKVPTPGTAGRTTLSDHTLGPVLLYKKVLRRPYYTTCALLRGSFHRIYLRRKVPCNAGIWDPTLSMPWFFLPYHIPSSNSPNSSLPPTPREIIDV